MPHTPLQMIPLGSGYISKVKKFKQCIGSSPVNVTHLMVRLGNLGYVDNTIDYIVYVYIINDNTNRLMSRQC